MAEVLEDTPLSLMQDTATDFAIGLKKIGRKIQWTLIFLIVCLVVYIFRTIYMYKTIKSAQNLLGYSSKNYTYEMIFGGTIGLSLFYFISLPGGEFVSTLKSIAGYALLFLVPYSIYYEANILNQASTKMASISVPERQDIELTEQSRFETLGTNEF